MLSLKAVRITMTPSAQYIQFFQINLLEVLKFFVFSFLTCISRLKSLLLEQRAMKSFYSFLPHMMLLPRVMGLLPLKSCSLSQNIMLMRKIFCLIATTL